MGYLEIVGAGVIWACTGPLLRLIQKEGFTSWDIVLARSLISTCLLGLYILLSDREEEAAAQCMQSIRTAVPVKYPLWRLGRCS